MNDRKYLVLIIFFVIISESDSGKAFGIYTMRFFFGGEGEVDYIKSSQFEGVEKKNYLRIKILKINYGKK